MCFCAGFFTDDLTIHNDIAGGGGKYLGVCQLPGEGRKVRVQTITMTIIRLNQNMRKRRVKVHVFLTSRINLLHVLQERMGGLREEHVTT